MSTTITIQLTTPEAAEEAKIVQDECARLRARLHDTGTPPVESAAINFILESITEHAISRSKEMTALFLESLRRESGSRMISDGTAGRAAVIDYHMDVYLLNAEYLHPRDMRDLAIRALDDASRIERR